MTRSYLFASILAGLLGCMGSSSEPAPPPANAPLATAPPANYDPLAVALADAGPEAYQRGNREASIPVMCYTRTGGVSNPCWVCHTRGNPPVPWNDGSLQLEYAFSDVGLTNQWQNLFEDRSTRVAQISDADISAYIKVDNYTPLMNALRDHERYPGFRPDLDLVEGFDAEGFAKDGSGWRALRYKPFLGTFWPTNGNTDDVFVRLPEKFRTSLELYKINLSILEFAVTLDPHDPQYDTAVRQVEPISETVAGFDLDGDGEIEERVEQIKGLPETYAGEAADVRVEPFTYPKDTEFMHSVRYVDPDQPSLIATRMKELRYSRNEKDLPRDMRGIAIEHEAESRYLGHLPAYVGSAVGGMRTLHGWVLQGFIEDENGWLRLQTHEEHRFCMGCHGAIGVQIDGTFTMPRKLPGLEGWQYQDLRGIADAPQRGHAEPEYLEYFKRNGGADELRANTEMLDRFFAETDGRYEPNEAEVRKAAAGGPHDLAWLLGPTRERALELDKAYRVIVEDQDFVHGRDATITPPANVHRQIENGNTENGESGLFFGDGKLSLDWTN